MAPDQLKAAQDKLGFKPIDMVKALKTSRRTYQDWLSGRRRIPGICEVAVGLLLERDARFMANIGKPHQVTPRPFTTEEQEESPCKR